MATTANAELTRGVLNGETLKNLTIFMFQQRSTESDSALKLQRQQRAAAEHLELLKRQRQVLADSSSRTVREAVIFVDLKRADGGRLRLRYLVDGATWSPSYNMRADDDRGQIVVEYNAAIQQMSGEDWSNVAMTLSTATPSLVAEAPVIKPLTVALRPVAEGKAPQAAPRGGVKGIAEYANVQRELAGRKRAAERQRAQFRDRIVQAFATPTDKVQGGNRIVDLVYRLVVENFGQQPVTVRLTDRLPTTESSQIKLTLVAPGKDLSQDPHYQEADRKSGILRWDLEVPAQAIGPKALTNEYHFQLEYDKQMAITAK